MRICLPEVVPLLLSSFVATKYEQIWFTISNSSEHDLRHPQPFEKFLLRLSSCWISQIYLIMFSDKNTILDNNYIISISPKCFFERIKSLQSSFYVNTQCWQCCHFCNPFSNPFSKKVTTSEHWANLASDRCLNSLLLVHQLTFGLRWCS